MLMRSVSLTEHHHASDHEIEHVHVVEEDTEDLPPPPPVALSKIMVLNKPEWRQILIASVSSVIMGCAMPLFAVLFGEIIGVSLDNCI